MDPDGKVIAVLDWKKRTVPGFKELMLSGRDFIGLRMRAEKGDVEAKNFYFIQALKMKHFKLDAAREYRKKLKKVIPEQNKEIDTLFAELEVEQELQPLYKNTDRSKAKELQAAAGKKFWEMERAGRTPGEENTVRTFYLLLLIYAEVEKDIPAFEKGLERMKERVANMRPEFYEAKEKILEQIKEEKKAEEGKKK